MKLEIKNNPVTGGEYCVFQNNGQFYYADRSYVPFCGTETMIFPCDEQGDVTSWAELFCDRSGMSLEECITDFIGDAE